MVIKAIIFDFFGVLENRIVPNRELLDYIESDLKPKYKIGIISNVLAGFIYLILSKEDMKLFDDVILSYKAGVAKPDPRVYQMSLDNLGIKAEEAVFIDDQERFCEAAEAVGMKAILYTSFEDFRQKIDAILLENPSKG